VIRTINLELDWPTVDEARRRVVEEIRACKKDKVRVLKVIHGWGSSGKGGSLRIGLQKSFALRKKEGVIRDFFPGEQFSIFDPRVLAMLEEVSALSGDPDLNTTNEGLTVVWIR
jgi:hypothetical protein